MKKLLHLIQGEILRLWRYKILFFGALVSFIWVIIIGFSDLATAKMLAPSLVMMDAGMMSIILLGSGYFLEKQEGSMAAILVSPVKMSLVLIAKIISALVVAYISFFIVMGSIAIFHGFVFQPLLMFLYVTLMVLAHSAIGFLLSLHAKDFLQMLMRSMGLILLFVSPILLMALDIIPSSLEFIVYLSPSYAGQVLFNSTFDGASIETWAQLLSIFALVAIPAVIYPLFVVKQFEKVAMEG